jgi:hypothetical protein
MFRRHAATLGDSPKQPTQAKVGLEWATRLDPFNFKPNLTSLPSSPSDNPWSELDNVLQPPMQLPAGGIIDEHGGFGLMGGSASRPCVGAKLDYNRPDKTLVLLGAILSSSTCCSWDTAATQALNGMMKTEIGTVSTVLTNLGPMMRIGPAFKNTTRLLSRQDLGRKIPKQRIMFLNTSLLRPSYMFLIPHMI